MDNLLGQKLDLVFTRHSNLSTERRAEITAIVESLSYPRADEMIWLLSHEVELVEEIVRFFQAESLKEYFLPIWEVEQVSELATKGDTAEGHLQFSRLVYWIVDNDDIGPAFESLRRLEEAMALQGAGWRTPFYQRQRQRLGWLSMHMQSADMQDELVRRAVIWGLREGLPVRERFDLYLLMLATGPTPKGPDRQRLTTALAQNEERLGESLRVSGETVDAAPTIANWLRDFVRSNQSDKPRGPVEEINYLEHNANVKKLSPEDRQILLAVLGIYDELLFKDAEPPLLKQLRKEREREKQVVTSRPPAFVTPVGATRQSDSQRLSSRPASRERRGRDLRPGILTSSRLSVTPQDDSSHKIVMKVDTLQDTFAKFQKEQAEVTAQMAVILAKAGIHNDKKSADVVNILREAVATGNRLRALASLQALGAGVTPQVSADQATVAELYNYLERKMGHSAAMAYKMNPVRPVWVGWYWRYILVDQLKMNEDEAMLWVVSLGSQLGGEYKKLVYLDQATKQLKWNELV